MSLIRKRIKNNTSKSIHKQKKNLAKKRSILIKFCLYLFSRLNFRISVLVCTALLCSIIVLISINKINTYSEKILPTYVNIEINNPQIYSLVNDDMSKAIFYAKKTHEKRSHFLNRVNNILFSYDQIDQYWIRLGFDQKLQISATIQVPLLILEAKGGDKYVISSTSKIIAKNPAIYEYPGLYNLSAPEIKLIWKPKATLLKNKINSSNNTKLFTTNKNPVNLPWLVNQTKIIYSSFQSLELNFLLNKVTWSSSAGFQLNLVGQKNSQLPTPLQSENNTVSILLGKENLVFKVKKLKTLLNDLAQKNLHPTEIDLDYADKASFKVSTTKYDIQMGKTL